MDKLEKKSTNNEIESKGIFTSFADGLGVIVAYGVIIYALIYTSAPQEKQHPIYQNYQREITEFQTQPQPEKPYI